MLPPLYDKLVQLAEEAREQNLGHVFVILATMIGCLNDHDDDMTDLDELARLCAKFCKEKSIDFVMRN